MTAPGTLMMAKMFVPETEIAEDDGHGEAGRGEDRRQRDRRGGAGHGRGAAPGAERRRHAHLVPGAGGARQRVPLGPGRGLEPAADLSGWVFAPVAWAMGVPWGDAHHDRQPARHAHGAERVRRLLAARSPGTLHGHAADPRSFTIATFALCGFANFSSIGIQIGGIGALAPTRRHDLARLGIRAMLAGTLANFMTATIAGFLL